MGIACICGDQMEGIGKDKSYILLEGKWWKLGQLVCTVVLGWKSRGMESLKCMYLLICFIIS